MKILHLSDIHFRQSYEPSSDGYKNMLTKMVNPIEALVKCLTEVNQREQIDVVVISGDLTDGGQASDYTYLKKHLAAIIGDKKLIVTLGNHDIKSQFRMGWLGQSASENSYNTIDEFEELAIISFDNSVFKNPNGHISEEQFTWLEQALIATAEKPVIVMTHHHLLKEQNTIPAVPQADKMINLLSKYHVLAILTGHTHHAFTGEIDGIPYYTSSSMSFCGIDEGNGIVRFESCYGYNIYTIDQGGLVRQVSDNYYPRQFLSLVDMKNSGAGL